jgi:hypothetical protein
LNFKRALFSFHGCCWSPRNEHFYLAAEDFTAPMTGKSFGKNVNRRLASWIKGVIAEVLDCVSSR